MSVTADAAHAIHPHRRWLLPELLEYVIEFVHRPGEWDGGLSKRDLSSCCLVSREWHVIARPRLFNSVAFTFSDYESPTDGRVGKDVLCREETSTLASFRDFLLVSPTLGANIRTLRLCREFRWSRVPMDSSFDALCYQKAKVELLRSLLPLLPRLQHLSLTGICMNERPPRLALSPVVSIRSLMIVGTIGLDRLPEFQTDDILGLLELFSDIGMVRLHLPFGLNHGWVEKLTSVPPATSITSLVVHSLETLASLLPAVRRYIDTSRLLSVLLPASCITRIASPGSAFGVAQAFLGGGIGAQLRNFGVEFGFIADAQLFGQLISLCPSLRSVTISSTLSCHWISGAFLQHAETVLGIARLVEAIPSPVSKIILEFKLDRIAPPALHRWFSPRNLGISARDQSAIDDALIRRFGNQLPLVHVRPLDAPVFTQNETVGLSVLFSNVAAAGQLRI